MPSIVLLLVLGILALSTAPTAYANMLFCHSFETADDGGSSCVEPSEPPLSVRRVNDTGISQCAGTGDGTIGACPFKGFPGQDAEHGRDLSASTDADGRLGFSFTKLAADGSPLPLEAAEWHCVLDNVTGLIWEVKTRDGGLRNVNAFYKWYDPDGKRNGGDPGVRSESSCGEARCDTSSYLQVINQNGLCGANDWRLPSLAELRSLIDYSLPYASAPALDKTFFPNGRSSPHWSSASYPLDPSHAILLRFSNGFDENQPKSGNYYIRAVRDDSGKQQ